MNPGAMTHPVQSMTSRRPYFPVIGGLPLRLPADEIRSPEMTTSPKNGDAPVPSTISPPAKMVFVDGFTCCDHHPPTNVSPVKLIMVGLPVSSNGVDVLFPTSDGL